jgi:hypothetical protein
MSRHRQHETAVPSLAVPPPARLTEPRSAVTNVLRLQRLVGNHAVASTLAPGADVSAASRAAPVVQRAGPTRQENLAALADELAAAEADPAAWRDVALRLNGFDRNDLPAICREIPDQQLQSARTAVERYLSGWPGQPAILRAIDARASHARVAVRPMGSSVWAAYSQVGYNVWSGEDQKNLVWAHIGGSVGKKYENGNTCAARVSWSLNHAGYPVVGGERNDPRKQFRGKKGDGLNYIVWVPSLQGYLTRQWGQPDALLGTNSEVLDFEATLAPDEVAVFAGPHHSGLIRQGYTDAYVMSDPGVMPVAVWKLPQ